MDILPSESKQDGFFERDRNILIFEVFILNELKKTPRYKNFSDQLESSDLEDPSSLSRRLRDYLEDSKNSHLFERWVLRDSGHGAVLAPSEKQVQAVIDALFPKTKEDFEIEEAEEPAQFKEAA